MPAATKIKPITYLTVASIALGMSIVWCSLDHLSEVTHKAADSSGFSAKAADLYIDGAKTLSSYSLLVLAGIAYFVQLVFSQPTNSRVTQSGKLLLIAGVFLCTLSLLSGYSLYSHIIDLFVFQLTFDPSMARLRWFHELQFWTFLGSLVLFGVFSIEALLD